MLGSGWLNCLKGNALLQSVVLFAVCTDFDSNGPFNTESGTVIIDDYWNSGYGRIIMVPRVKLAYDRVRLLKDNTYVDD